VNGILAAPPARISWRERLVSLLDSLAFGLLPPLSCSECTASLSDRCEICGQRLADAADVNAGIDAVENAATEAEALAAYTACVLGLAGAEAVQ
jgi:hypothetical protein